MRWGYRVAAITAATTLVLTSCSSSHHASSSASSKTTSSTGSTSSSTSSTTAATDVSTTAGSAAASASGGSASTRSGTRTTAAAPARATTTTTIPCNDTLSSGGLGGSGLGGFLSPDPTDERSATVTIANSLGSAVIVTLNGAHTIGGGGSQQLTLPPTHGSARVTATVALASNPGNRFSYSIELLPNSSQVLTAKAAGPYDCDAGHVHRPVYLVQSNLNIHS